MFSRIEHGAIIPPGHSNGVAPSGVIPNLVIISSSATPGLPATSEPRAQATGGGRNQDHPALALGVRIESEIPHQPRSRGLPAEGGIGQSI